MLSQMGKLRDEVKNEKKLIVQGETTFLEGFSSSQDLKLRPGTIILGNARSNVTLLTREGTEHIDGLCYGTNSCCFHGICLVNCEAHLE